MCLCLISQILASTGSQRESYFESFDKCVPYATIGMGLYFPNHPYLDCTGSQRDMVKYNIRIIYEIKSWTKIM